MTIVEEIQKLKKEKNAVILAHYYVPDEVQEIADYVGDSFYLSKAATEVSADTLVFCGVSFMGESAKILNPQKTVLMPDAAADCAMAHMVDVEKIEKIKVHADVCVTSSNAVKIVKKLSNKNIFFIPDGNLGRYVAEQVPEKNIMLNDGYCPIHNAMTKEEILKAKKEHPNASFLVHPECTKDILEEADYIGSTAGIIDHATNAKAEEFIIGTEIGVFYELKKKNPGKKFYTISNHQICNDMKLVTLEKVKEVLETGANEVNVSEEVRTAAMKPLERMLELGK